MQLEKHLYKTEKTIFEPSKPKARELANPSK
jgi:hypothetical protein